MKYYYVGIGNNGSIFDNLKEALTEVETLLEAEETADIIVRITPMTEVEFENLPEFKGY